MRKYSFQLDLLIIILLQCYEKFMLVYDEIE
jgi:hypothetical protein